MNRLKELRQEKKLTQQELADVVGVSKRTYIYWENNESQIKQEKAQQLADFFGVSVGYLLGYSEYSDKMDVKNLVYDTPHGGIAGTVFDQIAQIIGEKRMKVFLENTATSDFIQFTLIDNDNSIIHTKEAEMMIYFSLLDNFDKQLVYDMVRSLSDKVDGEEFKGYPLDKHSDVFYKPD